MQREMFLKPGEIQRFQVVTDVNKACERVIESDFLTREMALAFLEENRESLDLRGITGVFPYAKLATTRGEMNESQAWRRLQDMETKSS